MDGGEDEAAAKLKRMIFITDAMRTDELDSDGLIFVGIRSDRLAILIFSCSGELRQDREPYRLESESKAGCTGKWNERERGGRVACTGEDDGRDGTASRRSEWMVSPPSKTFSR